MDIRGYLRALRRNLMLIAICVVAVMAAAFVISERTEPLYESKTRVIVSSAQTDSAAAAVDGELLSARRASTYVEVVESQLVADRVRKTLGIDDSVKELIDRVSATTLDGSSVLELRFTDDTPERAQAIAQAYAEELVDTAADIETPDDGGDLPTKITVIDQASFVPDAVSPKPVRNLILAMLLGLVLGFSLAVLRELLDTSISSQEDLQAVTDAPVLGTIGHEPSVTRNKLVTDVDNHDPRVESFRVLRTNVQFVDVDSAQKVFVVTSSVQEEGKTSTAINLALTMARAGVRTLLVDGDLRRPRVATVFDIDGSAGVTTVLLGKVALVDAIWNHAETGLDVLPSGVVPPNAAELLQTQAMALLLERVRSEYEVVIIDSPPLLPVTDAALLASRADGVILVVRHSKTTKDQVAIAVDRLAQVDVRPVGVVLNAIPLSRRRSGYAGYGGYGSYASYAPKTRRGLRRLDRR